MQKPTVLFIAVTMAAMVGLALLRRSSSDSNTRPSDGAAAAGPAGDVPNPSSARAPGSGAREVRVHEAPEHGASGSGAPEPLVQASALHPVVAAIRAAHGGLEEKRAAMVAALESSGPTEEEWARQAPTAFESWKAQMPADVRAALTLREPRCYQAGCAIDVELRTAQQYEAAAGAFRRLRDDGALHGGRVQTPAIPLDDGRVRATWMMLRPEAHARAQ